MVAYHLELALHGLRRSRALTVLMIVAVGLGIGTCMTTLTVLHAVSENPLPGRSGSIYLPRLDPREGFSMEARARLPSQVTWVDGTNLLRAGRARQQALMLGGEVPIEPAASRGDPFIASARYTSQGFFDLFGVPFRYGRGWGATEDTARARVVVIDEVLNDRLFQGTDSVGRTIRLGGVDMRVVGVLRSWHPVPHFYDLNTGSFASGEDVYRPLTTARALTLPRSGGMECWGKGSTSEALMETADCTWLQFWVRLDGSADVAAYQRFLDGYVAEQVRAGRYPADRPARLTGLMDYLVERHVVPGDLRLQVWLAFGFLTVCLVNTLGLMLAKCLRRGGEIGVRRALGATRGDVLRYVQTENFVLVSIGIALGMVLAYAINLLLMYQYELPRLPASYLPLGVGCLWLLGQAAVLAPALRAAAVSPVEATRG
ncbi:ABC transporter permease [Luteibacter sp. PPL552]